MATFQPTHLFYREPFNLNHSDYTKELEYEANLQKCSEWIKSKKDKSLCQNVCALEAEQTIKRHNKNKKM